MQLVLSRIWTRVSVSISYDDNHYTMGTSKERQITAASNTTDSLRTNRTTKIKKQKREEKQLCGYEVPSISFQTFF